MNLYPSILSDSIEEAQTQLNLIKNKKNITVVQMDAIDGLFADNITVMPMDLLYLNFANLKIDVHLMVEEPMDSVWELDSVKEELSLRAIIAQPERMSSQEDYIEQVQKMKLKVGLSLDLHTSLEAIDQASWKNLDIIQIMGIEAGFQGQKFQDQVLEKIKKVKKKVTKAGKKIEILVDGGIKLANAKQVLDAGANGLVIGSELWQAAEIDDIIEQYSNL